MEQYIGVDLHRQVFHACESTVRSHGVRQLQRREPCGFLALFRHLSLGRDQANTMGWLSG